MLWDYTCIDKSYYFDKKTMENEKMKDLYALWVASCPDESC